MAHAKYEPTGRFGRAVHRAEETLLALLLGAMTLLTFANVVLRNLGGTALWDRLAGWGIELPLSILWSYEVTLILFSWLVLFGAAYAFKITAHLGVDAVTALFAAAGRKRFALVAGAVCIVYALLILKGAWDYWAPFADLPKFTGRVLPTGFDTEARRFGYTITGDVPIPFEWLRTWLSATFNSYEEGGETVIETYRKMPVLVPYVILPLAGALMVFRVIQATVRIWHDRAESLIVSHEAEEAVEEAARANAAAETRTAAPNLAKEG